jgi:hypothetical protein
MKHKINSEIEKLVKYANKGLSIDKTVSTKTYLSYLIFDLDMRKKFFKKLMKDINMPKKIKSEYGKDFKNILIEMFKEYN